MIRRPPVSTLTDTLVPDPTLFRSASDRLLLTAVDDLCVTSRIPTSTWSAMAGDWSEDQLLDLVLLVGTYTLIGMVVGGLDLPREPGVPGLLESDSTAARRVGNECCRTSTSTCQPFN